MYQAKVTLLSEVEKALRQWKKGIWLRGLAAIGVIAAIGLGMMILLRQFWTAVPWLIPALFVLTAVGIVMAAYRLLFVPLRQNPSIHLAARSIETRNPHFEDRLVTAVEQAGKSDQTSMRWLQRMLQDMRQKSLGIDLKQQLRIEAFAVWQSLFFASVLVLAALFFASNAWIGDFKTMIDSGFKPPTPPLELSVSPGSAHIKKGSAFQVSASFNQYAPENATLFFTSDDSSWQSTQLEMEASSGDFKYDFFDVQQPFQYYVKIGTELSDIYDVTVYEAPKIKRIDLTYTYPKHTGLAQRFEQNGGDIWAPVGTTVKINVLAEKPIVSAQLLVGEQSDASAMQVLTDTTAAGFLKVQEDSYYHVRLVNRENLDNAPLADYFIHAVQDNPPSITLKKPSRDMKATMLEEIPVVAEVGNDFGLEYARMAITVNSEPEIYAPMQPMPAAESQNTTGFSFQFQDYRALLYLEDLEVEIGDFVTYYVAVKDRSQKDEIKSDIYFIDVKNFENIYNVAESQGSGGGGGMGSNLELSLSQREIITATTRLQRDRQQLSQAEFDDRRNRIKNAQEEVRKTAEQIASMSKMQMGRGDEGTQKVIAELDAAVKNMRDAEGSLEQNAIENALKSERDAYTHLVRAEMAINQRQLQNSQAGGSGGGARMQNSDELARLFQDELDKLKNKYETLQQGDKGQSQQAVNEAMQKIKELARRQQAINEQSRQLAHRDMSEEEKKRELKKLQRQQEQLQRDAQQAMQQQSLNRDVMNELQRAADEMQRASNNMRQQQSQNALSSGQQAQDRLENIEDRLRKSQQNALRDDLKQAQDDMQRLAERQKRLADSTATRAKQQASAEQNRETGEQQQAEQRGLQDQLDASMRDLQSLSREHQENPEVQRQLSQLNRDLQRSGVLDRMEQAGRALQQGQFDQAERLQRSAQNAMEESAQQLGQLASGLEGSKEEKLESALQDAQDLRRNLENRLQQPQTAQGEQQQSSERGQTSEQQGARIGNPQSGRQRITQEMIDQWKDEIWRTRERLSELQQQFRADSLAYDQLGNRNELDRATDQALDELSGFVRTFVDGDQQRIDEVVEKLIDPLRRIEAELQAQIQLGKSEESLRTVRDQPIPPEYKEMVEEYYRSLSKSKE